MQEIRRLSVAGLEGPALLRRVADALRRAVPFDAFCGSTVDPASNLMVSGVQDGLIDNHARCEELNDIFLNRVYFEEDLGRMVTMLREGRLVALLSEETGGSLERSVRYRDLLRPLGFRHELTSLFADRSLWGTMDLVRASDCPDFAPREVNLVRAIAPHIGAGLKAAMLHARATAEPDDEGVPGVLTLDHRGRIAAMTPAAERHLADLGDLDPDWRLTWGLPMAIRMVASALDWALHPRADRHLHVVPRVRVRGRSGRWLTLHGSHSEPRAERPAERVIVIAPAHPEEVAWLNMAAYGLSRREEDVIKLVVRGFSTRQLSEALFISEHTVQRHLTNIFEKVGVRSRRDLLKRLFIDHLLPGLSTG
ncbi:MAG: LuxR C-terminal-related transcriptional regulator [Thermomicrobiales bacterium]